MTDQQELERAICATIIHTLHRAGINDTVKFLAENTERIGADVLASLASLSSPQEASKPQDEPKPAKPSDMGQDYAGPDCEFETCDLVNGECACTRKFSAASQPSASSGREQVLLPELASALPTHRCKVCSALWRFIPNRDTGWGDSWNLRSKTCGPCCDGVEMADQIEPLTWAMFSDYRFVPKEYTDAQLAAGLRQLYAARASGASDESICGVIYDSMAAHAPAPDQSLDPIDSAALTGAAPADANAGGRGAFHDEAWNRYRAKVKNDPALANLSIHTFRAIVNSIYATPTAPEVSADVAELIAAAEAVVARWDSPMWKYQLDTATYIERLRAAISRMSADGGKE